jgi:hypothetical protein
MNIPDGFEKIMNDFIIDIDNTFPEYSYLIKKIWIVDYEDEFLHIEDKELKENIIEDDKKNKLMILYNHCVKVFPERFFDIIYENKEIFDENSIINTEFLPRIMFKYLWNSPDITDKTRETLWKYLQLILMTIIGSIDNKNALGDTAKLFEDINEDELKMKMEETLNNIQSLFQEKQDFNKSHEAGDFFGERSIDASLFSYEGKEEENKKREQQIPDNLKGLLDGKLGKLAIEIAQETANDLNLNESNIRNTGDIFKQMFKNSGKLINMMKNVGDKIDNKIKTGQISESELMSEGLNILNKIKETGNMGPMQDLFKQMGLGNIGGLGGKNEKINLSAMQTKMEQQLKESKRREMLKQKLETKKQQKIESECEKEIQEPKYSDNELTNLFDDNNNIKINKKKKSTKYKK